MQRRQGAGSYNLTNWLIKLNGSYSYITRPGLPRRMGSRGQPEESRAAILQAAAHEFAAMASPAPAPTRLPARRGVNKALLYYYFKDKETLYGAVLDDVFSGLKEAVFAVLDSTSAARKDAGLCGRVFRFHRLQPAYPRLMQREMMRAREGQSQHIDKIIKNYIQPIFVRVAK